MPYPFVPISICLLPTYPMALVSLTVHRLCCTGLSYAGENISERAYIRNEARVEAENGYQMAEGSPAAAAALEAAESRLTIAIHYKIPYPRPFNVPPKQSGAGRTPSSAVPEH